MRMHNSGMQLLVCAVYIMPFSHYYIHYEFYKLAGSALSHSPVNNCTHAYYVCRQISAAGGRVKQAHLLVWYTQICG